MLNSLFKHRLFRASIFRSAIFQSAIVRRVFTPFSYRRAQRKAAELQQWQREVGAFFARLPRCTSKLLLVSPIYSDWFHHEPHRFQPQDMAPAELGGEILVRAQDVINYFQAKPASSYCSDNTRIVRAEFMAWLGNADFSAEEAALIPRALHQNFLQYEFYQIIKACPIEAFCLDCLKSYQSLTMTSTQQGFHSGWNFWEEFWRCEAGHLIYKHEECIHMIGYFPSKEERE